MDDKRTPEEKALADLRDIAAQGAHTPPQQAGELCAKLAAALLVLVGEPEADTTGTA